MRRLSSLVVLSLLLGAASVQAQTLGQTSRIVVRAIDRSLDFTSDTTTSVRDMKIVRAAREDAASFVASDGAIHGAQLQAAFVSLRQQLPQARHASDRELAEAILAL